MDKGRYEYNFSYGTPDDGIQGSLYPDGMLSVIISGSPDRWESSGHTMLHALIKRVFKEKEKTGMKELKSIFTPLSDPEGQVGMSAFFLKEYKKGRLRAKMSEEEALQNTLIGQVLEVYGFTKARIDPTDGEDSGALFERPN